MTPQELDAIRARAERATPGPWEHRFLGANHPGGYINCSRITTATVRSRDQQDNVIEHNGDGLARLAAAIGGSDAAILADGTIRKKFAKIKRALMRDQNGECLFCSALFVCGLPNEAAVVRLTGRRRIGVVCRDCRSGRGLKPLSWRDFVA